VKDGKPSGIVATIHGFSTYVARPEGTPKGLVVLIPDVFGWELSNCRLLADAYAKEGGLLVYLPNFMNGESPQPILHHSESLI
jgi:dienelactone hydrolase